MHRFAPNRPTIAAVLLLGLLPAAGQAQVRASERATISQTVDGTVFTINHARPRVRGRQELFGRVVHWGEVWTPGANWATTLEVNRDVTLDGHAVKQGKYSVWFVVQPREWTMVLDPRPQLYHTEEPDSTPDQIRWQVTPVEAPAREVLTWSFPDVRPDGATLQFEWGTRRVSIDAVVSPSHPLTIARSAAEPFLGSYAWRWADDSTGTPMRMELYYADGMIRQRHTPFPDWYPLLQDQPMVQTGRVWFIPAIIRDGKVWEMVADMIFEFTITDGKATGFELRDDRDTLIGSGARVTP